MGVCVCGKPYWCTHPPSSLHTTNITVISTTLCVLLCWCLSNICFSLYFNPIWKLNFACFSSAQLMEFDCAVFATRFTSLMYPYIGCYPHHNFLLVRLRYLTIYLFPLLTFVKNRQLFCCLFLVRKQKLKAPEMGAKISFHISTRKSKWNRLRGKQWWKFLSILLFKSKYKKIQIIFVMIYISFGIIGDKKSNYNSKYDFLPTEKPKL